MTTYRTSGWGRRIRPRLSHTLKTSAAAGVAAALIFSLSPGATALAQDSAEPAPAATGGMLSAEDPQGRIGLTLSQETGAEPFNTGKGSDPNAPGNDSDPNAPGNDSGPNNEVIRTNDYIRYNLGIKFSQFTHTRPTVTMKIPRGQQLAEIPAFCQPGSEVTPTLANTAAPVVPLNGQSWEKLPSQTFSCVLVTTNAGAALNYPFRTKVRPEVPHGTVMEDVSFSVRSEEVTEPVTISGLRQQVSAAARFDLSKRGLATAADQGPVLSGTDACRGIAGRESEACRFVVFPATLTTPFRGKGASPLADEFSFTEVLEPAAFYGETVWKAMVEKAGSEDQARRDYGAWVGKCESAPVGAMSRNALPYGQIRPNTAATATNSVRNSGTIDCSNPQPGKNATITVKGADTSAYTVPTQTGSGVQLASDSAFVFVAQLYVYFPQKVVLDFGTVLGDGRYVLDVKNNYTDFKAKDLAGNPVPDSDAGNNVRDVRQAVLLTGNSAMSFSGIWGMEHNTPATGAYGSRLNSLEGLPGSLQHSDGKTVVMEGQSVQSNMETTVQGIAGSGKDFAVTYGVCEVWNGSQLALASHPQWEGYHNQQSVTSPSGGQPAWISFYTEGDTPYSPQKIGAENSAVHNLKIQYGAGASGSGAASDCWDGSTTWFDNPTEVPGVHTSTDEQGRTVYEGINRVRVTFNTNWPQGTTFGTARLTTSIGHVVLPGATETYLGGWMSQTSLRGIHDPVALQNSTERRTVLSDYTVSKDDTANGDRVLLGKVRARIGLEVKNPLDGSYTREDVRYERGTEATYRLSPQLARWVEVGGVTAPVLIEMCLPQYQNFVGATQGGKALEPVVAQKDRPQDAEIACDSGGYYLRFNLGELAPGAAIAPIEVTSKILETARPGSKPAVVQINSPVDPSEAALRSSQVNVNIDTPKGINVALDVSQGIIDVNPAGIANPSLINWEVSFANILVERLSDVVVMVELPQNDRGKNEYDGTSTLTSVSIPGLSANGLTPKFPVEVYYSSAAPVAQPALFRRAAEPAARAWTHAGTIEGAGTSNNVPVPGNAEALRFVLPGEYSENNDFRANIQTRPERNKADNIYQMSATARAEGVTNIAGPSIQEVKVVSSTIGDFVWHDLNGNGIQEKDEPGIKDVKITATGTDNRGNAIEGKATTDADGKYQFTDLPSGKYKVTYKTPDGYIPTKTNQGNDGNLNSEPNGVELYLGLSRTSDSIDFGFVEPGQLSGKVFWDKNHNGTQEEGEPAIKDVEVQLIAIGSNPADQTGAAVVESEWTDEEGHYSFTELNDGQYIVKVVTDTLPDNFFQVSGSPNSTWTGALERPDSMDVKNVDFGYSVVGVISGTVFEDSVENGTYDEGREDTFRDISVGLFDAAGKPVLDSKNQQRTAVTDGAGRYVFERVPEGTYQVKPLAGPEGYVLVTDRVLRPEVSVEKPTSANNDFGYSLGVISGTVFEDSVENGTYDEGQENTFGDISVGLFDAAGEPVLDSENQQRTAVTDGDGLYVFDRVPLGKYSVKPLAELRGYRLVTAESLQPEVSVGQTTSANNNFGYRGDPVPTTEPTSSTEPTEPTSSTEPTEPTSSTEPTEPTSSTEPTETTTPTEPTEPTSSTEPTEPTSSTEPTETTTPTEPTEPTSSTEPVPPVSTTTPPVTPTPVVPVVPVVPVLPSTPASPPVAPPTHHSATPTQSIPAPTEPTAPQQPGGSQPGNTPPNRSLAQTGFSGAWLLGIAAVMIALAAVLLASRRRD